MRRLTSASAVLAASFTLAGVAPGAEPRVVEEPEAHSDPSAPSTCIARDADGWLRRVDCETGQEPYSSPTPDATIATERPGEGDDRAGKRAPQPLAEVGSPSGDATEGEEADDELDLDDIPCVFVGRPGCGTQPHVELGMGWGESHSYVGWQWSYRGFVEAGMLVGVHRNFQLGPVFELGFDTGRVNSGFTASSKLKSRYWIAGWYITLDTALGAAFERFTFDGGTENGARRGPTMDLAFTVLGALGPYVSFSQLGDTAGNADWESRILVGFRGALGGWAVLFYPFGEAMSGPILIIP